jgi:hypothetical protein
MSDEKFTLDELRLVQRRLERMGLIESRLCEDGQVRWFAVPGKEHIEPHTDPLPGTDVS